MKDLIPTEGFVPARTKRGGARPGAGRKRLKPESHGAPVKSEATEIIASLGRALPGHASDCLCWKCLWKKDAQRLDSIGHAARKYLWDRRDGKPVDHVNHVHDSPLDINVKVSLAETIQKARKRATVIP